ncbi:MAG: hypothetical protein A3F12_07895 [Gammaproteobacteria bacterium RIFCSPHIGHO2_12_FULL_38_14]|nr:MAG: hypothetical protein A3F12_07895 [Gammaproteobacteria bacterium RIFCSPHIGHO2_12_FULL_38_14]
MTAKVMFSFPDKLVTRMKATIPPRERSRVLAVLLENEIIKREQKLYSCAKELEESTALKTEMAAWDSEFSEDGLKDV